MPHGCRVVSWSGTPVRLASGHTGDIVALATQAPPPVTAANGGLYASTCRLALTCGGSERSVRVWDTTSWDQVVQFQVGDDAAPTAVSLAAPQSVAGTVTPAAYGMLTSINARFPNVTWAAVGQDNGVVRLFRLDAVACVAEVCPGVAKSMCCAAWECTWWRSNLRVCGRLQWQPHRFAVTHITWCINDRVLITGDEGGHVFLTLLPPSPNPLLAATDPSASRDALASVAPQALHDVAMADVDAAMAHAGSAVTSLHCSPLDPSLWAIASANGKLTVWRAHILCAAAGEVATASAPGGGDQLSLQLLGVFDLCRPWTPGRLELARDDAFEWLSLAFDSMLHHATAVDMIIAPPSGVEDGQRVHLTQDAVPLVQFAPNSTVMVCAVPWRQHKPRTKLQQDGQDDDAHHAPVMACLVFYCLRQRKLLRVVKLHEAVHCMAVTHVLRPAVLPPSSPGSDSCGDDGTNAVALGSDGGAGDVDAAGSGSDAGASSSSSSGSSDNGRSGDALTPHLVVALGTTFNRVVVVDERGDVVRVTHAQAQPITSLTFFDQTAPDAPAFASAQPACVVGLAGASGAAVHVWDDVLALA